MKSIEPSLRTLVKKPSNVEIRTGFQRYQDQPLSRIMEISSMSYMMTRLQAFYINLVIGTIFAPASLLLLPSYEVQPGLLFKDKCKTMDWIAILILSSGAACFTVAISFGGTTYVWDSGSEIAFWAITGVLLTIYHPLVAAQTKSILRTFPGSLLL